ncbi:MAG: hypothetical protein FD155_971 [Bacteroidetes bacterium]|nr:MAG: hypothetical protein FD155_971 [Bacteroidota bacterium]
MVFRVIITFLLLLAMNQKAASQVLEPIRMELPARIDVPTYQKILLGEKGVMLFYESTEFDDKGKRKWYFNLYDTAFSELWLQHIGIADGYALHSSIKTADHVLFLFTAIDGKKNAQSGYELIRFDIGNGHFQLLSGQLPDKAKISGFASVHQFALIGVNLPKFQSDLLLYDLDRLSVTSLPHLIAGQSVIQAIEADHEKQRFMIGFKRFESNKFIEEVFQTYNELGQQQSSVSYTLPPFYLHSYKMMFDQNGKLLVAGSFDNSETRRNTAREAAEQNELSFESKGLFFIQLSSSGVEIQRFHPFDSFTNIYKAMSTDDLMRVRQRQSRKGENKSDIDITFQFYNPRLIPMGDKYIYAAEAFKPQYRVETRMDYDFYGRMVPFTYTIFEGFNYFSVLLAGFDSEGSLLWSNDLELRDMLLPYLQRIVEVKPDGNDLVVAYVKEGMLTSKIIDSNGIEVGQTEQSRIENLFTNDRLLEENFSEINYWYDHFFLVNGYQRISNNRLRSDNSRKILYLQKVAFE